MQRFPLLHKWIVGFLANSLVFALRPFLIAPRHNRQPLTFHSPFLPLRIMSDTAQPSLRASANDITEEVEDTSVYWCPAQQIYVGGVPENAAVDHLIQENDGLLRIFGYGSLCWNPGAGVLAHDSVTTSLGRAKGYRRCWSQKSTDHRGTTSFPGIVCTLLTDDEFRQYRPDDVVDESMTEGVVYVVPPSLVQECLSELDFREKGGYARDIINVLLDDTGQTVQCLLYRGTPDNPAFWQRALQSPTFAAAVISSAIGPSGPNDVYLHRLGEFLQHSTASTKSLEACDDTFVLTRMEELIRKDYDCFFFHGCGSNQHNQLLLKDVPSLVEGQDAHELTESVLIVKSDQDFDPVVELLAGSGHSGAITAAGRLFLFGWNADSQLGSCRAIELLPNGPTVITELAGLRVSKASLGFSHTLAVSKGGQFFAFGDNGRGQVTGTAGGKVSEPCTPPFLDKVKVVDVSAGLYHSAVVTEAGELVVFGCSRHGQSFSTNHEAQTRRWMPFDGVPVIKAVCGRYHTLILDGFGRVWSFGDNRLGQLGRETNGTKDSDPKLVHMPDGYSCFDIDCGWSHSTAFAKDCRGVVTLFGWGRNDRGQLGTKGSAVIAHPTSLLPHATPVHVSCGSESVVVIDDQEIIWCCGWNEHGNLSTGETADRVELSRIPSPPIILTPGYRHTRLQAVAGGAQFLVGRVYTSQNAHS